jgi:hypothetical protein
MSTARTARGPVSPSRFSRVSRLSLAALAPVLAACAAHGEAPRAPSSSVATAPSSSAATASVATTAPAAAPPSVAPSPSAQPPAAPPPLLPPPPPPPSAGSTKVTAKSDPAWASCHRAYAPAKKDVARDVDALARGCAKVTKMKPLGATLSGKQSDADGPQSFPLKAEANHCYRVYGQGSDGIRDLDVAIHDSTGALAGQDATDDATPIALEDGAICFKESDAATIVVSVGLGKGTYALQVWGD